MLRHGAVSGAHHSNLIPGLIFAHHQNSEEGGSSGSVSLNDLELIQSLNGWVAHDGTKPGTL